MTRDELIEGMASTAAESLNGGSWSDPNFYVEVHKQSWRKAVEQMLSAIEALGYVVAPREATMEMMAKAWDGISVAKRMAGIQRLGPGPGAADVYRAMIEAGKV